MITREYLLDTLRYNEQAGTFTWAVNKGKIKAGAPAGYKREGYTYITIDQKDYPAHHLVWLIHNDEWPNGDIDHKDMNRTNNHISNLRTCSRSQNMLNIKAHKDSKSGVKGVSWCKTNNKWVVRITVNGSYKNFGSYDDLELAQLVAEEAREKYHGEFCNHG